MPTTALLRRTVARPFQGVGRQVAFLATGVLIQLGVLLVMALPWTLFVPAATWPVLLAVLVPLSAAVAAGPLMTVMQHARFRTRLGVDIPLPHLGRRPGPLGWLRTVAKHTDSIFAKLDLPKADADHRRVLAVLRFLGVS